MGSPGRPRPVKLFMSIITPSEILLPRVLEDLGSRYGEIEFESSWMAFDFTDYYTREMGGDLKRKIVAFRRLISPDGLPGVKHETNQIEQNYAKEGRRQVNIDPGYVSTEHMILATTKPYAHRPYLRDGIYADLTLIYRKGSFRGLEWTYPDYGQPDMVTIFNGIRKAYVGELKGRRETNLST